MMEKMKEQKKLVIVGICVALLVVVAVGIYIGTGSGQRKLSGFLDLGQKYLEDMAYEDAILVFDEAIAIDPKCAEAYLGKAQAQYALGQLEEAVDTLRQGIEQVDDSTELEVFLQQILDEMIEESAEEKTEEVRESVIEMEESARGPLLLNYARIVRRIDTLEPNIQLEVLGGGEPENYIWESSNPECVTVSETGLLTCFPTVGDAYISVRDAGGRGDYCDVQIVDSDDIENSEEFRMEMEDERERLSISVTGKEDQKEIQIVGEPRIGGYVYHSGDVSIPEKLVYQGESIPVTSISCYAYDWCNTMESIKIPATVEVEDRMVEGVLTGYNPFYYCTELRRIDVDANNPQIKSVDGVLYSKDGKTLYSYPAAKSDTVFTIPSEVEQVYSGAFVGCKNLEKILVDEGNVNYESIDGVLMDKEGQLVAYPIGRRETRYIVPDEITKIAENAFYMSGLKEVVCRTVENITSESFRQCTELERIEGGSATQSIYLSDRQLKNHRVVELGGIDEMHNLEGLSMNCFDYITDDVRIGDLEELGKLDRLKSLNLGCIQDSSGFSWIKNLKELESIIIAGCDISEDCLAGCGDLTDLKHVELETIESLSDISWIENLTALERFEIYAETIEMNDFSELFELSNLRYIDINNYSESSELGEWFENMRSQNPDIIIYYTEWVN